MKPRWKDDAVSPVIATILIVAITVVLTAVLYTMVVGMGGGGNLEQTPAGSWSSMAAESSTSAKLTFGMFQPPVSPMNLKLIIDVQNSTSFSIWWTSVPDTDNYTMSCDNANITAFYHDINPEGNQVGGGDSIMLYGLEPYTYYYVKVYHYESDSVVEMAGTKQFQTAA